MNKSLYFYCMQSNEVANSYDMELEGLKHFLAFLRQENQLIISDIITDRHSSVKKYLQVDYNPPFDTGLMYGMWLKV